ncbi:MAG: ABC transporter ATP-binding protein [Negativicutes bacterium]|jgi:iron complex transport system ATP-binding protein
MLEIKNLDCWLNGKQILHNINFSISKNEFVGIIGANGAGKSTLLKCLGGINKYSGDVVFDDVPLNKTLATDCAKIIGYMDQDNNYDFPFTASEVVMMGRYPHLGRFSGESARDHKIVEQALTATTAANLAARNFQQLSGGERQRVLFARVLAQQTPVVLLDEPTSALDISCKEQLFELMKAEANSGKTVIATIHDIKDAARHCSRLLVMKAGAIIADGAPDKILTDEIIRATYGLDTIVYFNRMSGGIDYFVHKKVRPEDSKPVHLICGGGVGAGIARYLSGEGNLVSMGVLAHGDSDLEFARSAGLEVVSEQPFSAISDRAHEQNVALIKAAHTVIIANIPFGKQTVRNLEACRFAKNLIILEDEPIAARDYSGGIATEIYNSLRENATIIKTAELASIL